MDIHPALLSPPAPPEPVSVIDVAEHILASAAADGMDSMETSKLHSLVYLSQGWHLACSGTPLFHERVEAWTEGPIVPELHALLEGAEHVRAGDLYAKLAESSTVDPDEVLHRAQTQYGAWYDADPAPGEEDSPSHEYVREVVPDLIEALRAAKAEARALRAQQSVPDAPRVC